MNQKLPPQILLKGVCSFLGHPGFYWRFMKECLKIAHPLCQLIEKYVKFQFDEACMVAFRCLNDKIVSTPAINSSYLSKSFK